MFLRPVKSTLKSWEICLGLAPLPERIIEDIHREPTIQNKLVPKPGRYGSKVAMTEEEINNVIEKITPLVENKKPAIFIYNYLIANDFLPKNGDGKMPSIDKISSLIKGVRKELGITRHGGNTFRLFYEMHEHGLSDEEIAKKLRIKVTSVQNLRSAYRRSIGLPRKVSKISTKKMSYDLKKSGLSIEEIADRLNLKISTVHTNISKYKKELRERY
jgi:hypothetical protein